MIKKIARCTVSAVCLWALAQAGLAADAERRFTFAVVPQHAAGKIIRQWSPVMAHIRQKTGYELQVVTAKDIPEFERRLAAGQYDFAYMNPWHFVYFNEKVGYRAVAHQKDKRIKGIIVVRKDSPYQSLDDLKNSRLAFPAPAAFAASILTQANLRQQQVPFTSQYVSSHDSVYLTVEKGLFPAGGGVVRTLNNISPAVREQLRILWTSPGYTPHAVAAHPEVPETVRVAVQQALLGLADDHAGRQMLEALSFKNGFVQADDSSWDDVRRLEIDLKPAE